MRITRRNEEGTYTFVPTSDDERDLIGRIAETATAREAFRYEGRHGVSSDIDFRLNFNLGGEREEQVTNEGGATFVEVVTVGGIQFSLQGDTEEDRGVLGAIRNACFFGKFGLVFIRTEDIEGEQVLFCCTSFCKECEEPAVGLGGAEHGVCDSCAEKCDHVYEYGLWHGSLGDHVVGLAIGDVCTKCGRVSPETIEAMEAEISA